MGDEVFVSTEDGPISLKEEKNVVIRPGETALLQSFEKFDLPKDCLGLISLRFRHKVKGLVNISGFHVGPGYTGRLTFSIYNAGPNEVVFRHRDPVFMIIFNKLNKGTDIERSEGSDSLEAEWIQHISGPEISLSGLDERTNSLESKVNILIGLLITLVGGLIIFLIRSGGSG